MTEKQQLFDVIPEAFKGLRLDSALVQLFPDYSRARLQKWIRNGDVSVDGKKLRPRDIVMGGEQVKLQVELMDEVYLEPQAIDLDIVYEDDFILIINKAAGLVVHPGAGNFSGTMANGLLHHAPEIRAIPRVGIVHRLDKDTTGLLVVAKDLKSHTHLAEQLQQRTVSRKYIALVHGEIISGDTIDAPIGRHPVDRKRMAVKSTGKPAVTHFRIQKKYKNYTLLKVHLETGRTHQIRVHMSYLRFPIVGDTIYGKKMNPGNNATLKTIANFPRQALHAESLSFVHPQTKEQVSYTASLPKDIQELLDVLETDHVNT